MSTKNLMEPEDSANKQPVSLQPSQPKAASQSLQSSGSLSAQPLTQGSPTDVSASGAPADQANDVIGSDDGGQSNDIMNPDASDIDPPDVTMPDPTTNELSDSSTVADQLNQLLASDSDYLEQGRQQGLMHASQRGLQNSTLAAQAGEQARIAQALPIASQDAQANLSQDQLNQNTINQFALNEMDHYQSMIERAQQGDINAQLQLDQYGFNSALSMQENIQRLEQLAAEGDIQAGHMLLAFNYDTMMAGIQQGYALDLNSQQFQNSQALLMQQFSNSMGLSELEAGQRLTEMNAAHENTLAQIAARSEAAMGEQENAYGYNLQAQYLGNVAARQQAASEEIRLIQQTEGLTPYQQQAAVRQAQQRMEADIAALQAFYSSAPQWTDSPGFGGDAGDPPDSTPFVDPIAGGGGGTNPNVSGSSGQGLPYLERNLY